MRFSKRILSIILALLIFISVTLTPVSAVTSVSADTGATYTSGDYQYKILEDGTIEITDYFGTDIDLVIPSTIDGYSISSWGYYVFAGSSIESVEIPKTITEIKQGAFHSCKNLKSVSIPGNIKSVNSDSFTYCTNLTNVTIENGVEYIGYFSFSECENLSNITLPNSLVTIGREAFLGCIKLKSIIIPANVKEIGNNAFGYEMDDVFFYYYKINDFKIYGYPGTAGEEYAVENEFEFIPLDKGDADESTAVDINDVTCMQKIIAKINSTNDFKTANCDLNGDGKLNIRDATLLQLFLAKKIDKFPVQE